MPQESRPQEMKTGLDLTFDLCPCGTKSCLLTIQDIFMEVHTNI